MTTSVVIIGAGGFGREVLDIVDAIAADGVDLEPIGFVDDGEVNPDVLARLGAEVLGGAGVLADLPRGTRYVVAVGSAPVRRLLVGRAEEAGLTPITLVHPSATQGRDVEIGTGSIICAGVRMTTNIRIGMHCHVNLNSTIGHDSVLDDFVSINPLVAISGNVRVCEDTMLGTGSAVLQGLAVGPGVAVGGGAVVVKDVQPGQTVVGIPAKPLRSS